MQDASATDSGVYECIPDNAPPARVKVHILTAGNLTLMTLIMYFNDCTRKNKLRYFEAIMKAQISLGSRNNSPRNFGFNGFCFYGFSYKTLFQPLPPFLWGAKTSY